MAQPAPVTNSEIGRNGRFGNQLFQYMFLVQHAHEYGISFANSPWAGDQMFCIQPGREDFPMPKRHLVENLKNPAYCPIQSAHGALAGADLSGYFQYHTAFYARNRNFIRAQFRFSGAYAEYVNALGNWLHGLPGLSVALHIRRGDYGTGVYFIAPCEWYHPWLDTLKAEFGEISVYIATDDPHNVLPQFKGYNVYSAADAPTPTPSPGYFADFAALTLADHVGISNSSFSFAATMFNAGAGQFMRPSLSQKGLIRYDPWAAPVLLTDITAERAGENFMSERAKSRSKYKIRKFLRLRL